MGRFIPLAVMLWASATIALRADIIITRDGMILNGKIIEENADFVKFGNYHGIFNIERGKIKEMHGTESYEADARIFRERGGAVDVTELKANFESGLEKIEQHGKTEKGPARESFFMMSANPFFIKNMGKLQRVLDYSYGASLAGDLPLRRFGYARAVFISDLRAEMTYFLSRKEEREVTGLRASAGPLWRFPVSMGGFHFSYCVYPAFGAGRYVVTGIDTRDAVIKWNLLLSTGPVFTLSAISISPAIHFSYIHDSIVPLYGIGLGIGVGYGF